MSPNDIQSIFFQECEEGLASAETALMAIKAGEHDGETINTIFRAVHSIKGGAGAFGFNALQAFTHHFETLLDKVRDGELALTPPLVELLMGAFDVLADHVTAIRGEGDQPDDAAMEQALRDALTAAPAAAPVAAPAVPELSFDLAAMMAELAAPADAPMQDWRVTFAPTAGDLAHGSEPLLLLRELAALGGELVRADADRVPTLDGFDPDAAYMGWTLRLPAAADRAKIEEVFDFVADPASVTIERAVFDEPVEPVAAALPAAPTVAEPPAVPVPPAAKPAKVAAGATIRVDLEKLDRLVDLVGELVITQSMLSQRLVSNGLAAVEELADLDQLTRELQDSAMAIRAQPVKSVFSRVPRIVRELEASTGKRV